MRILKKWSVVAGGALWSMLAVGCGNMATLADQANQANDAQSSGQAGTEQSSGTGGSLALSSTNEADASVKKISITVKTSLQCDEGHRDHRGHKGKHDRRPPPPPGKGHGGGRGDMPPPPRDDWDEEDQDFKLADGTDASTTDSAEAEDGAPENEQREEGMEHQRCVVAQSEGDFDAASALQLDEIPVGTYYVVVVLSDENGKAIQQGNAKVEIKAGEISAAEITLEPVPEGSVAVTIKQAGEEEASAEATVETATEEATTESTQEAAE